MPERKFAYTVLSLKDGYVIARAVEGIRGTSPVLKEGKFDDYQQARVRAEELNSSLGLSDDEAQEIIGAAQ
jgi:hypothetical protein